jgi:hypothetical protein
MSPRFGPVWHRVFAPALLSAILGCTAAAAEVVRIEVEGSALWQQRNDFAIPGLGGSRVSIDEADRGPFAAGRATLHWRLGEAWSLRALAAPLRLTVTFTPAGPVSFQDAVFSAGVPAEAEYVFDSYRLSVYRRWDRGRRAHLRLGFTAKLRDARIALSAAGLERKKTNVGFVPLIYAGATAGDPSGWSVDLDVDALGAPQGYAVDGSLRIERPIGERVRGFAGYRLLDGGADNDEVHTFATFHYATAGFSAGW